LAAKPAGLRVKKIAPNSNKKFSQIKTHNFSVYRQKNKGDPLVQKKVAIRLSKINDATKINFLYA